MKLPSPAGLHRHLRPDALAVHLDAVDRARSHARYAHERVPLDLARDALVGARVALQVARPLTLAADALLGTGQPTGHAVDVGLLPAVGHVVAAVVAAVGALLGSGVGVLTCPLAARFDTTAAKWIEACAERSFAGAWQVASALRLVTAALGHGVGALCKGLVAATGALVALCIGLPAAVADLWRGEVTHDDVRPGEPCRNATTLITLEPLEEVDPRFFCRLDNDQGFDIRELATHVLAQRRWTSPVDLTPLTAGDIARLARHPSGIGRRLVAHMAAVESSQDDLQLATLERLRDLAAKMMADRTDDVAESAAALVAMRELVAGLGDRERHALDVHAVSANGGSLSQRIDEVLTKGSCTRVFAHDLMMRCAQLLSRRGGAGLSAAERGRIDRAYAAAEVRYLFGRPLEAGLARLRRRARAGAA